MTSTRLSNVKCEKREADFDGARIRLVLRSGELESSGTLPLVGTSTDTHHFEDWEGNCGSVDPHAPEEALPLSW